MAKKIKMTMMPLIKYRIWTNFQIIVISLIEITEFGQNFKMTVLSLIENIKLGRKF